MLDVLTFVLVCVIFFVNRVYFEIEAITKLLTFEVDNQQKMLTEKNTLYELTD